MGTMDGGIPKERNSGPKNPGSLSFTTKEGYGRDWLRLKSITMTIVKRRMGENKSRNCEGKGQ